MDLRPTDAQDALVGAARHLLDKRAPLDTLAVTEREPGEPDGSLWPDLAALGWLGLTLSEEHGGGGGMLSDQELLCEVMGRHLVGLDYLATAVAAATVLDSAAAPVAAPLLAGLAAGSARPVLAVTEDDGHWRPDAATSWNGDVVTGTKRFVVGGAMADRFLVTARGPSGVELVCVDRTGGGISLRHPSSMPGGLWSDIEFDAAPATALGAGWPAVDRALSRTAAMQAGWCAGAAAHLLEMTVRYVSDRHQFGVPIGSFQAVQHRLADCAMATAEAETLARQAAARLDAGHPAARRMASTAFVRAADAFVVTSRVCHQVWGGIGFCTEAKVHLFSRRAKATQHLWGGAALHLSVIAKELRGQPTLASRYDAALRRRGLR